MSLWSAVLRRLLGTVGVLVAVSVALFAVVEILPGDAVTARFGPDAATDAAAQAVRHQLGLDRNPVLRYLDYVGGLAHGDLGTSVLTGQPVADMIVAPVLNTAVLGGVSFLIAVPLIGWFGFSAGRDPGGRRDRALSAVAVALVSIPEFVVAVVLIAVMAVGLRLLPPVSLTPLTGGGPLADPRILVLPVVTLLAFTVPWCGRQVRAAVAEVTAAPYVQAAEWAGLPRRAVLLRHLLPSVVGPSAQAFAYLITFLFGGTVVVERAFNYPGLGSTLLTAVTNHDTALLEAAGLLLAGVVSLALLVADVAGLATDPRRRAPRAGRSR